MKTPGAAVLLLLWAGIVAVAGETCQPDIYNVLKEISALVKQLRWETNAQAKDLTELRRERDNSKEVSFQCQVMWVVSQSG
ncbi:hypothetical protein AALO_G00238490 [Alosa alosa]|uniref:Uncharacterized protein n=1 Tax=Alosa alosa TaxID=278164 RepID=A0AAV6FVY7_9TELE|nr:hypothetical protein AALO_G00238490 [Alosa alosa]